MRSRSHRSRRSQQPRLLLPFHPAYDAAAILAEARRWQARHAAPLAGRVAPPRTSRSGPEAPGRLRIGRFLQHVQSFFLMPLLRNHDRLRLRRSCLFERRTHRRNDGLVPVLTSIDGATSLARRHRRRGLVRADRVDVLVDSRHAHGQWIGCGFRAKAVPCADLLAGVSGDDGSRRHRLSTDRSPPRSHRAARARTPSNRSICPTPFGATTPSRTRPEPGPLPALSSGRITFGSLNNSVQTERRRRRALVAVLQSVDGSRLLLLAPEGKTRHRVRDAFARNGVDPRRVEFTPFLPRPVVPRRLSNIDIALDPFPANGHTTSLDAFWMGVPGRDARRTTLRSAAAGEAKR